MKVHVTQVSWTSHSERLRSIRGTVFIEEQNVPKDLECDGADEDSTHFLAVNEAGLDIGCARLMPCGQIGRMAVLPEYRGNGTGFDLLRLAVETAARQGFTEVFLHAQDHAEAFYRKAGFCRVGDTFEEAGIAHVNMELALPVPFDGKPTLVKIGTSTPPVHPTKPDSIQDSIRHSGEGAMRIALTQALSLPRRELVIYSQKLDASLFDSSDIAAALSAFVRRARVARVRVLIHATEVLVGRSHAVVELARRISSKVSIRVVPYEMADADWTFIVWDHAGHLLMPDYREYEMVACEYDPVTSTCLSDQFEQLWRTSRDDPELRTLKL